MEPTTETLTEEQIQAMVNVEPKPLLTQLMEIVGSVPKDGSNDYHHYRFSSARAVLDKVQAGLIKLGLYSVPVFEIVSSGDKGLVTVKLTLSVYGTGETPIAVVQSLGSGMDSGDKAVAKSATMALKYAWMTLLNIPTGDDPEADTQTDARTAPNVSQPGSTGKTTTGIAGFVENAKVKEVRKKSASERSPYLIILEDGQEYQTFDKDIIAQMSLAQTTGLVTSFKFKETTWGRDIIKEAPKA